MCFQIQTQRNLSHAIEWICCCLILHNLIVDIERELKLDSSLAEFGEAPVEEENSGADVDQEDGNEEPEMNDDLATSTGQAFRRQVMNILLENM
jgi:hypothetical protein